jgi:hypothetical protein
MFANMMKAGILASSGGGGSGFNLISTTWTNATPSQYSLSDSNKTISRNSNTQAWSNPARITDYWSTGIRSIDLKLTATSNQQRIQLGVIKIGHTTSSELSGNESNFNGLQFAGRSVNDIFTLEHNADTGQTKWFINGVHHLTRTSTISGGSNRTFFFQEYEITKTIQIVNLIYDPTIGDTKFVR